LTNPVGARVTHALAPLTVFANMSVGNELALLPEFGNAVLAAKTLEVDQEEVPAAVCLHVGDLVRIQEHANFPLVVPEEIDPGFARELRMLCRMLDGEVVTGTWDELTLNLKPGVSQANAMEIFGKAGALVADEERYIELPDGRVELGRFTTQMASAELADDQPDEEDKLRLVPGKDNAMSRRAGPAFDPPVNDV
jgi:hypothetical protein